MSGTDHSVGCKCGNCKGLIEEGNLVPLFIPNHEEIKMRKLLSQTKSKVVLEPSGQHLVIKDMTTDPSLVIDISTTSSRSNTSSRSTTLLTGETPLERSLWLGGANSGMGGLDNSMNIYTISSESPVQKFSTAYKYGVSYNTDGSYISALYWLSQAAVGAVSSRVSNYLSPIAFDPGPGPPPGDPGEDDPDPDPGSGGTNAQAELYMTISRDTPATQFSSYPGNLIAIPSYSNGSTSITLEPAFDASDTLYLSFYTTEAAGDWFNEPIITHGGTNWDSADYVVKANADGTENATALWSDNFGGTQLREQTSGTLTDLSTNNQVNYVSRWRNSLKIKDCSNNRGNYNVSVPSNEIQPQGAGGSYAFSATFTIISEANPPKMKVQVFNSSGNNNFTDQEITNLSTFTQVGSAGVYTYPIVLLTSYSSTDTTAPDPTPPAGQSGTFNYGATPGASNCPYIITYTPAGGSPQVVTTTGNWVEEKTTSVNGVNSPYQWSFDFDNLSASQLSEAGGTYSISVDASGLWTDVAGNKNVASDSFAFTAKGPDTTKPTMTITGTGGSTGLEYSNSAVITPEANALDTSYNIRFVVSEPTTDFIPGDVTLQGGSFNSSSFVESSGNTIFDISFVNFVDPIQQTIRINVPEGVFSDAAGNTNQAVSELTLIQPGYPPPTMTIIWTGGYSGETYSTDNGSSFTGKVLDTSYNVRFICSAATTDFVPSSVNLQNGTFNSSSFVTTGDNTIFDISFVNTISYSNSTALSLTLPADTFTAPAGQIPNTTSFSLDMNQPPYIIPTGSTTDPSDLPSYITGVDTATSQIGGIPGVLAATTYPDLSNAYYKIDVVQGYFYTIETSVANPSVDSTYALSDLSLSIWTGDSSNYFENRVKYSPNVFLTSEVQPPYSANVTGKTSGYVAMNYPIDRTLDSDGNVVFDPSAVQANGFIYLRVNDEGYNNNGYFNIVVKSVLLPELPSVEVLATNTITRGQIIYDNVRNIAYDIWQITLTAGYQYRFTTYQDGAATDTIISLWNSDSEQLAREASGTNPDGALASNDDYTAGRFYSQFLYPATSTLPSGSGGTYYVRVEQFGQDADASYNILVEMASTNLTPYFDYNANTYASTQTDVSRCLLYGFGGPDSGNYSSTSLSPYFTSNGIPRAFTSLGFVDNNTTLGIPTADEKEAIKSVIYAWTEPMGMPSQELVGPSYPTNGWNGTLDSSANFKIYIVEQSELPFVDQGLEGLCFPPGTFRDNLEDPDDPFATNPIILVEGYMLLIRKSGVRWTDGLKPGGYGYNVILHEFGHGFGFSHPFDIGGGSSGVFPGVTASDYGLSYNYQPYILGDNSYNQIIATAMAYSSSLQFTGFNYHTILANSGTWDDGMITGTPGYSEMLGTPTPLDVATLTSLYDYRRDASNLYIGMGGATYWLDADYRSAVAGNQSTNVFGWTTISIRLPPNGTTSETEYDGKLYIDAYSNNDASNDVVIDLRRTQVQMWQDTSYVGLTNPDLLRLSYLIPPGMIKENNDEPYVDFDGMAASSVGAANAGKGGCMISEFCSAPGGISAYGSNVPGSSCMIYSNLGVATSSQDNTSPTTYPAGAFVGPGPGELGRSKINGGTNVTGNDADSVRTASVIYSRLDPSFANAYTGNFSTPTTWQDTYYFEIDDTSNRIKVYLGSGSDYQTRFDATATSTDGDPGKLPNYTQYYDEVVTDTISQFVFNNYDGTTSVIPTDVVCLAEGTEVMVWKPDTKKSFYKKIENITAADYVVTYGNGPKKVLGVMESYNFPVQVNNWHKKKIGTLTKNMAMYRLDPKDYPELKKELYLTGGHSLLKTKMSNHERTEMNKIDWPRKFRQIDGLWKVLAHVSENANPVYKVCKVYNMVLDQDDKTDMFKNYAIYANGMLVETCNIQHLHRAKKLNQMMKYDTNLKKSITCRK